MRGKVRCECCQCLIPVGSAIQETDDTYLCPSCDEEVTEEAARQYESECWYELNRVESLYRRQSA